MAAAAEILRLRAHPPLCSDAEGQSVTPAGGRAGRGEATADRVAIQGPGPRPGGAGRRGPRVAGGRVGLGSGAGHALLGRLGRAGTRGRRACCRYARVPDGGDTRFPLGCRASGARVGRPLGTRQHPGVDFPLRHTRGTVVFFAKRLVCGGECHWSGMPSGLRCGETPLGHRNPLV